MTLDQICLQLWRSYAGYDVRRRFSTWMYRVALNTAISFARGARARQRRTVPLDDSGAALAPRPFRHAGRTSVSRGSTGSCTVLASSIGRSWLGDDLTGRKVAEASGFLDDIAVFVAER